MELEPERKGFKTPNKWAIAAWSVISCLISIAAWLLGGDIHFSYKVTGALCAILAMNGTSQITANRYLRLREYIQIVLVSCFIGTLCRENFLVWSVPKSLADVFLLSRFGGSLFFLLYCSVACGTFYRRYRMPSNRAACALLSIPLLFTWLLLLVSPELPQVFFGSLSTTFASSNWGDIFSRILVLFVFNLTVVFLLNALISRHWTFRSRLLALISFWAVFAAMSPRIVDLGQSIAVHSFGSSNLLALQIVIVILSTLLGQAALWGQTYMITGFLMDALMGRQPTSPSGASHAAYGAKCGAVYSIVFLLFTHGASILGQYVLSSTLLSKEPILTGLVLGALLFGLAKTIIESFDGSDPFALRLQRSFADPLNYLRGAAVGMGIAMALVYNLPDLDPWLRSFFGFWLGAFAYAGIHLARDIYQVTTNHRLCLQRWSIYAVEGSLGGVVGMALAWYAEQSQLQVIVDKLYRYSAIQSTKAEEYIIYPLFSKWGSVNLGLNTGGGRLLFNESLSGVISWSLAAPLFSLNLVLLSAILYRTTNPLKQMFTSAGLAKLVGEALRVERWGLWMAPIIYSFLRMSGEPAWYNQDGAIRSVAATIMSFITNDAEFAAWSLNLFTALLAYDWLRVLIWFDHMGLRVATLVNLSFIGGDLLDEKASRAMGHSASTRCIPEGLRRFGTWMPLLIPFYIPRGPSWNTAWDTAEVWAKTSQGNEISAATYLCVLYAAGAVLASIFQIQRRSESVKLLTSWTWRPFRISNEIYSLELDGEGRGWSRVIRSLDSKQEIDLTKRPDSPISPAGKTFYLVDSKTNDIWSLHRSPILKPQARYYSSLFGHKELRASCDYNDIRIESKTKVALRDAVEHWELRLSNHTLEEKRIRLASFRDLVLQGHHSERHPAFNELHITTCYVKELQAILASNRLLLDKNKQPATEFYFHAVGPLPSEAQVIGYEDSRAQVFQAGSERAPLGILGTPRLVEDEGSLNTFDPVASHWIAVTLPPRSTVRLDFVEGWATSLEKASQLISHHLGIKHLSAADLAQVRSKQRLIRHNERKPNELPWAFSKDGTEVFVAEDTPRPWAHPVTNPLGYGFLANNEGSVFSFNGNAQQHSLTPFTLGLNSATLPGQAWHIWDLDTGQALLRLPRRLDAKRHLSGDDSLRTTFGRGYVQYRMRRMDIDFCLEMFVLPDKPAEVRLLKLRNDGLTARNFRLTVGLQMVLAELPGDSRSSLSTRWDKELELFITEHPWQQFRRGPVFVAPCFSTEKTETMYSRYLGKDRTVDEPLLAATGLVDEDAHDTGYRIAAFSSIIALQPGEEKVLPVIIGQSSNLEDLSSLVQSLRATDSLQTELARTKKWWNDFLSVLRIETEDPTFDRLVNDWLPYQLTASRLWGRTGPYQRSGAFGFRDQLQDVIPLAYIHPDLCRSQILLHAAQQFREGDTMQWWHQTWEGKTGLGARNKASDVMLWLPYVTMKYLSATGDTSILDEQVCFLEGKPIPPDSEGICFAPRVSRDTVSVYEHCIRAIDLVLERRGPNGVPLMGAGDWNDGLDRVGRHGRGESIWLGFFLHRVLLDFAGIVTDRSGEKAAFAYRDAAEELRESLNSFWRNNRFIRATNDHNEELIYDDALTSSWPIIADAVPTDRGEQALRSGLAGLMKERIVLLLNPAFNERSKPHPGRIALYPEGVRENGGQYSHGSSWLVDAAVSLAQVAEGQGDLERAREWHKTASEIWYKISPLQHSHPTGWLTYGLEPHQQPADVYYGPGYEGRGGWSWYTGSAGRMLSAAWSMLGIEVVNGKCRVKASGRTSWPKLKRVLYRGEIIRNLNQGE